MSTEQDWPKDGRGEPYNCPMACNAITPNPTNPHSPHAGAGRKKMKDVTVQMFIDDCRAFREKLGQRTFWQLPIEKRDDWMTGLGWTFMMCEPANTEENYRVANMFEAASAEYARRTAWVLTNPLTQPAPDRAGKE